MAPLRVCVTGAGGRTGLMALRRMAERPEAFSAFGTARTQESAAQVTKQTKAECRVCNVLEKDQAAAVLAGVDVLVVLSSATPKPNKLKMLGVLCKKFCLCNKTANIGAAFEYPKNGMPERVDWEGVRNLLDEAARVGVKHVIVVGSMGGTITDHFLNKMGGGNILLWKRKAEIHLINSGLCYTIIHPGGLLPHMGNKVVPGGQRKLVVAVDDELMNRKTRSIPREDVAEVVVQCALNRDASAGRAFDLCSEEPEPDGKSAWDRDLKALLDTLGGKNCDYASPKHEILG